MIFFSFNISLLLIIYTSLKVKDRSKRNLKTNSNHKKMNMPLGVFRLKLSTDQKGIMICLEWVKSQKSSF